MNTGFLSDCCEAWARSEEKICSSCGEHCGLVCAECLEDIEGSPDKHECTTDSEEVAKSILKYIDACMRPLRG